MSNELTILRELAAISATQRECQAVVETIRRSISSQPFMQDFDKMIAPLAVCYQYVEDTLAPFTAMNSQSLFDTHFDTRSDEYQQNYLASASIPRHGADQCYDSYVEMFALYKEFKTGYPLLKQAFLRLEFLIDKYVGNDAKLLMSIDALIKRYARFLSAVAELKKSDSEEAFEVYDGLMSSVAVYLQLLGVAPSYQPAKTALAG